MVNIFLKKTAIGFAITQSVGYLPKKTKERDFMVNIFLKKTAISLPSHGPSAKRVEYWIAWTSVHGRHFSVF